MSCIKVGQKILSAFERSHFLNLKGVPIRQVNPKFQFNSPYILDSLPDYLCTSSSLEKLKMLDGKPINGVAKFLDKFGQTEEGFLSAMAKFFKRKPDSVGFSDLEFKMLYKKAFPNVKIPASANYDMFLHLNRLSKEAGSQFDAHGLAKVSISDQLKQLNVLLSQGIKKDKPFCTAPLVAESNIGAAIGTGSGAAYRDGSFIVVSGRNKTLLNDGIEYVIVNDAYYKVVDDLAKKFPNVKFVKADVAPEYFEKIAGN